MKRIILALVASFAAAVPAMTLNAQQPATAAQGQTATLGGSAGTRVAATRAQTFSTTIQGNALNSTNGQLSNTIVRLRDARLGRIVDSTLTDKSGLFAFHAVDPGSYIVEIMSTDRTSVLAASQILNVNAGDIASAVVKLPFRIPPFAGVLGGNAASATPTTATAVVTEAAASSVLAVTPPITAACSCSIPSC
jgi:hypothetical protein